MRGECLTRVGEMAKTECAFCKILAGDLPSTRVDDDERTITFMDINPVSRGHALVIPQTHSVDLSDIDPVDFAAVCTAAHRLAGRVPDALGADGVNLLVCSGRAAWQTVFHFHIHVIPRYAGDGVNPPWPHVPGDIDDIKSAAEAIRA